MLLMAQANAPQLGTGYDWLMLVSRVLHILGAIILVGGFFYVRAIVTPATVAHAAPEASDRAEEYFSGRRAAWAMWVGVASFLLLATGFWNYFRFMKSYDLAKSYHMVIGIKMLVGIALMFVAALLAGRSPLAQKFRQQWRVWLNVCLVLGVIVVALGSVLRTYPRSQKLDAPVAPTLIAPERSQR
jgi:uncharacterized membrane protein